jgi:acyl-CoA thioester hydrolase
VSVAAPFRYYLRVRYQECDAQHVVFNARYGDYIDLAITEFMKAALPGRNVFDGSFEFQLVRQLIEWRAPARFDDVLEITVSITRLGTSSFTAAVTFQRAGQDAGDSAVLATCETVYVHVDHATWRPAALPQDVRDGFTAGARGRRVDHAGYLELRGD